jgi:hypothetical protein
MEVDSAVALAVPRVRACQRVCGAPGSVGMVLLRTENRDLDAVAREALEQERLWTLRQPYYRLLSVGPWPAASGDETLRKARLVATLT